MGGGHESATRSATRGNGEFLTIFNLDSFASQISNLIRESSQGFIFGSDREYPGIVELLRQKRSLQPNRPWRRPTTDHKQDDRSVDAERGELNWTGTDLDRGAGLGSLGPVILDGGSDGVFCQHGAMQLDGR